MSEKIDLKKCQHFIPQGYLRKFAIEGEKSLIWQYDKTNCLVSKCPVSIRKICCRDYYYYQRDQDGNIDHVSLEDAFSNVERIGIQIIEELRVDNSTSKIIINEEELGHLSFFLALLLTRGPAFRNGINKVNVLMLQKALTILYKNGKLPEPPEILKNLIDQNGLINVIKTEISSEVSIEPIIAMAEQVSRAMLDKIWTFYVPFNSNSFVVSDNPVSFRLASGDTKQSIGPAHPNAEITIPLRKDLAVIIGPSTEVHLKKIHKYQNMCFQADESQISAINTRTIASALQFVYSSQNSSKLFDMVRLLNGTKKEIIVDNLKEGTFSIIENPYKKSDD